MRLFREVLKTKRNFPLAALIFAVMTERFGVSHETMVIWRQASARNIGIVATGYYYLLINDDYVMGYDID